jgi:death-on-curing protein
VIRYLTLREVLLLHERIAETSGGATGVGDLGALQSAIAAPKGSFSGQELYVGICAKAAALGFAIIANHPFVDGNKRVGHGCRASHRLEHARHAR